MVTESSPSSSASTAYPASSPRARTAPPTPCTRPGCRACRHGPSCYTGRPPAAAATAHRSHSAATDVRADVPRGADRPPRPVRTRVSWCGPRHRPPVARAERTAVPPAVRRAQCDGARYAATLRIRCVPVADYRGGMAPTDLIDLAGHEQVVFCYDPGTGLRAVIALHSTALGPGLGGTRFHPYDRWTPRSPTCCASPGRCRTRTPSPGSTTGGGKAVILGDPHRDKTPELLRAYGRFVESLGGPLRHRLRRRHLRRRHGRRRRGDPLGHRPLARSGEARATPRSSPRSGSSRGCAPPPSTCGASRRSGRPAASASPASGRSARLAEHLLEDGAEVVVTDVDDAGGRRASSPGTPRSTAVADAAEPSPATDSTSTARARSAEPSTTTPSGPARAGRLRRREQPARRRRRRHGRPAGRAGHHLRARLPRQRRRGHPGRATSCTGSTWSGPGAPHAAIFEHTLEVLRTADADGITPGRGRRPASPRRRIARAAGIARRSLAAGTGPARRLPRRGSRPRRPVRVDLGGGSPTTAVRSAMYRLSVTICTPFPGPLRGVG